MDEITFLKHLDDADKDLDAFPFWRIFKKACADNPIKGIKKMTPGSQAVIILWEANTQYRGSDGLLKSVPLDGENIEDKLQKLKEDLISHFLNEDLDGGEIILQGKVPIMPDDTVESLTKAIQRMEYSILPTAIEHVKQQLQKSDSRHLLSYNLN